MTQGTELVSRYAEGNRLSRARLTRFAEQFSQGRFQFRIAE